MSEGVLLSLAPAPETEWDAALERAAAVLRGGGVVSFATDTFYALGADPLNETAVQRVFRIKRRGRSAPLPVLVRGLGQAERVLGGALPPAVVPLLEACWPGPLTLVLPARRPLPAGVAGPDGCVGLRWPGWAIAEALLRRFDGPITGSSANRSGSGGPSRGSEVAALLEGEVDLVLDTGPSPGGPGSTVARYVETGGVARLRLIRAGRVSAGRLAELSGLETTGPAPDGTAGCRV